MQCRLFYFVTLYRWFYLVTWNFGLLKNKMICFEDNFGLLWLYCLKICAPVLQGLVQTFLSQLSTTKISSFDFTSPFIVSWGFSYRETNFNFLRHNIWIIFNNIASWRFQFFITFQNISVVLSYFRKCFIYSFLKTTNFFTNTVNTAMNVTEMFIPVALISTYFCSAQPCVCTNLQLN